MFGATNKPKRKTEVERLLASFPDTPRFGLRSNKQYNNSSGKATKELACMTRNLKSRRLDYQQREGDDDTYDDTDDEPKTDEAGHVDFVESTDEAPMCNSRFCKHPEKRELSSSDLTSCQLVNGQETKMSQCYNCLNLFHLDCVMFDGNERCCGWCTRTFNDIAACDDDDDDDGKQPSTESYDEEESGLKQPKYNRDEWKVLRCTFEGCQAPDNEKAIRIASHLSLPQCKPFQMSDKKGAPLREKNSCLLLRMHCFNYHANAHVYYEVLRRKDLIHNVRWRESPNEFVTARVLVCHTLVSAFQCNEQNSCPPHEYLRTLLEAWAASMSAKGTRLLRDIMRCKKEAPPELPKSVIIAGTKRAKAAVNNLRDRFVAEITPLSSKLKEWTPNVDIKVRAMLAQWAQTQLIGPSSGSASSDLHDESFKKLFVEVLAGRFRDIMNLW